MSSDSTYRTLSTAYTSSNAMRTTSSILSGEPSGAGAANFSVPDYIVFACMLCISTFIGVYYAWKDRTKKLDNREFLTANKSLALFPVAMSLLASFQSSVTILGYPAEMFLRGTQFWMVILAGILASIVAAEVFLPVYYNLSFTSVNKYLSMRFGSETVRLASSLTFIAGTVPYMGVVLYGPSLALSSVTPLEVNTSIVMIGVICTFYTTIGGIKAVVWTDTIQVFLMFAGLIAVMIRGFTMVGGIEEAFARASAGGRLEFFNIGIDPSSTNNLWNVVFGMGIMWCGNYCTSQTEVQRYCNVSTKGRARTALYINMFGMILLISCACLCGIALFAVYGHCDPLKLKLIERSDQLMPYFVMDTLSEYPGIPGLFVACVFSASLSTLSSGFNALATVTWDDLLKHTPLGSSSDSKVKLICKLIGVFYGVASIGMAFFVSLIGSVLQAAISLAGALFGPLFGLYLLAFICPFANAPGVTIGLLAGQSFTLWILAGSLRYPLKAPEYPTWTDDCRHLIHGASPLTSALSSINGTNTYGSSFDPAATSDSLSGGVYDLYHMAFLLVPISGFVISLVVGAIASSLTGGFNKISSVNPNHLSPIAWFVWPTKLTPCKIPLERNTSASVPAHRVSTLSNDWIDVVDGKSIKKTIDTHDSPL